MLVINISYLIVDVINVINISYLNKVPFQSVASTEREQFENREFFHN